MSAPETPEAPSTLFPPQPSIAGHPRHLQLFKLYSILHPKTSFQHGVPTVCCHHMKCGEGAQK